LCSITGGEITPDVEQHSTGCEFESKIENDDCESEVRDIHGNRILCAGEVGGRDNVEILAGDLVRSPSRVFVGAGGPHAFEAGLELNQDRLDLLGERRSNKLSFGHAGLNRRLLDDDGAAGGGARVSCTKGEEGKSGIS
jgi:hypothetical protein